MAQLSQRSSVRANDAGVVEARAIPFRGPVVTASDNGQSNAASPRKSAGAFVVAYTVVVGTLLALPAVSFCLAIAANQLVAQPRQLLGAGVDYGFLGGLWSFLTTPTLMVLTRLNRSQLPVKAYYYLLGLCAIGVVPIGLLVFYFFAIGRIAG